MPSDDTFEITNTLCHSNGDSLVACSGELTTKRSEKNRKTLDPIAFIGVKQNILYQAIADKKNMCRRIIICLLLVPVRKDPG